MKVTNLELIEILCARLQALLDSSVPAAGVPLRPTGEPLSYDPARVAALDALALARGGNRGRSVEASLRDLLKEARWALHDEQMASPGSDHPTILAHRHLMHRIERKLAMKPTR